MRTDTQFVNMHTFLCIAVFQCSWTNWSRHRTFLKKKKISHFAAFHDAEIDCKLWVIPMPSMCLLSESHMPQHILCDLLYADHYM